MDQQRRAYDNQRIGMERDVQEIKKMNEKSQRIADLKINFGATLMQKLSFQMT